MLSRLLFILLASIPVSATEIKVMIIDTGIASTNFNLQPYVNKEDSLIHPESYNDWHGHGTHVAGLVTKNTCSQVSLYSCAFYDKHDTSEVMWEKLLSCYQRAHDEHMDYINLSGGGDTPTEKEFIKIKQIVSDPNVTMIVAAGNGENEPPIGKNLGNPCWGYFPACYDLEHMVIVGNEGARSSNYGYWNMEWEDGTGVLSSLPGNNQGYMTGTSQSTAIYTNKLLLEKCKEINKNE